ncbi:MAG: nucleotidyltransferase family protein [Oligoflexia bacterium]|nr:nucleotidyltransferase family protein [Oligoflexia bacterium]
MNLFKKSINVKAMILAAGKGERLGPLTKTIPKPMLEVAGRPLMEWTILHLRELGIVDIVINLNFNYQHIVEHFGDGEKFGVKINYSYEDMLLGTAGAVKHAQKLLEDADVFLVLYGDVVSNFDYRLLINKQLENKRKFNSVATILLHKRKLLKSNSIVEVDGDKNGDGDGRIVKFLERPAGGDLKYICTEEDTWVNSGLYSFDRSIFNYIDSDSYLDFPKDVFNKLVNEGSIYALSHSGYRMAVDSPERYFKLCQDVINERPFSFT